MGAVQHVFRRGATYWWRRRLIKKTGESGLAPIAISLGTREPVVCTENLNPDVVMVKPAKDRV